MTKLKTVKVEVLEGTKVKSVNDAGTGFYNKGVLNVFTKDNEMYRITTKEVEYMMRFFDFEKEEKRVYTYLTNPEIRE